MELSEEQIEEAMIWARFIDGPEDVPEPDDSLDPGEVTYILARALLQSASRVAALEAEVARLTEAAEKTTLGLLGTLDGSDEAYFKARDRVAALEAALREPPPPCHICKTTTDKHQLHCSAAGGPSDRILLRAMAALSPTRDGEERKP